MDIAKQRRGNLLDGNGKLGKGKMHLKKLVYTNQLVTGFTRISSPEDGLYH